MKLLIVLIAMGVIVLFGLVDYSYAQTTHTITFQEGHWLNSCHRIPNGCVSPENITVNIGDIVIFENPTKSDVWIKGYHTNPSYSHTVFYMSEFIGSSHAWIVDTVGKIEYSGNTAGGTITVYGTEPVIPKIPIINGQASYNVFNGTLNISISEPQVNKILKMNITHSDLPLVDEEAQYNNEHIFASIVITQNDMDIYNKWSGRIFASDYGRIITHLDSDEPLEIKIKLFFKTQGYDYVNVEPIYESVIFTTDVNPTPDPPRTLERPPGTSTQEKDRQIVELRSQLNIYRQQLDEKDDIISDQREEIQEQQKKIDKQRKTILNKKGALTEEKKSDDDRLISLENTIKLLMDHFNISKPIQTIPGTNDTDNQLQTKLNTLQSRYNTLEANYNSTTSELSDLRSRFNTIESLYNSTIDDNNEKQHTIDKLTQELNTATKRIEELESRDSQFQGSSSDESSNDDETSNEPNDEPIEPIEIPTLSITLPDSMFLDNTDRTIDLYTYGTNNIRIDTYYPDTGTQYYINDKADITIFRDTEITNRQFITTNQDSYCYVGDLVVGQDPLIPISVQHTNSLQLQFRESDDPTRCDQAPNILFNDKLSLNKEVYIRFVGTDGQIPFYYTNEIVEIPKCTTDNFDDNTDTLLNNIETCYGKSGSDTVIVSKVLAVFGITNQDIS